MALTRKEKGVLVEGYKANVQGAKSVVLLKQSGIPVNNINQVRMEILNEGGRLQVVKKRMFMNFAKEAGYNGGELNDIEGSAIVLYSYQDEYAPLKVIAKYVKQWKKADAKFSFEYLGGWFENNWKDKDYVSALANLPSKQELVGKFLFLLNYPITSFARGLDQIRQKKESE